MANFTFPENCKIVNGFTALGIGTAGAVYGVYISLKNVQMAWAVINYRQGDATQVTWSVSKATAIAGTNNAVCTELFEIWSNLACATSDRLVHRTPAATYQFDVGQATKLLIFQIDPSQLGDYDCIRVYPSSANIPVTSAWAMTYVLQPRYPSQASTAPTVVAD